MSRASHPRKPRAAKSRQSPPRETAGKPPRKPRTGPRKPASAQAPSRSRSPTVPRLTLWLARITRLARVPSAVYLLIGVLLSLVLVPGVNWLYQVARKPSELFFPVSDDLYKTPSETWRSYGPLFLAHSTAIMTPELLAALAQKEASGNPVARTYWRWATTLNLFEIYRPASSAVGMYQFTDGTFEEAKRYCIHDHRVVADGPWHDMRSCWFNNFYARVIPSHAVELASSNLDRRVREILARQRIGQASVRQQQELAILTHLCGAGAANRYAARGLRLAPGQRCGDHDPRQYIERVMGLTRVFARLRQ
ncbi:MAG: transglycosylase SLT domain-containing protein [Proteobacteria bacterium]|nr:transglycosylase SLT domain-containing protein [Pseudomonadota bacterium]